MIRALTLTKYHYLSLWNWRSTYLARLIEPAAYFLFLAAGISGMVGRNADTVGGGYYQFVLAGLVCLLTFRAATTALSDVSNDRKWGVFAIYSMQGGGPAGYLISIVLTCSGVFVVQVAILFVLTWTIDAGGGLNVVDMLWLFASGLIVSCGWVTIGASVGTRVHSYARRNFLVTITTLPVVLAAPLFYPLENAPTHLRVIANLNPLTYQVGWLREAGSGRLTALLLASAWALAAGALAMFLLRSADRLTTER